MQIIGNYIALGFLWLFSLQPLRVLYIYSDLMYHVIRLVNYRRRVINENLRYSFPDKSREELRMIRLKFYRNFCDIMIETIKLQNMSEKQMRKRVKFINSEYIDQQTDKGRDVVCIMGHYGCWEWIPSINLHVKALSGATYRPLKNKQFDRYMIKLRTKWGNEIYTMNATVREIVRLKQRNQRFVIGLIADQSPSKRDLRYFTNFLNQNTAILTGPEKIAKATKSAVAFLHMNRVKRGYYEVKVVPLVEDSVNTKEFEITELHVRYLEKMIINKPECWLWSHKRWKFSENRLLTNNEETNA